MVTFITSFVLLLVGYLFYGSFVEKVFGVDANRKTPCFTMGDGVDYIPMPTWKVFLIQFLNIAGTGPIFGAILGVLYGPSAYLWIVLGCIFGGAVHDYLSGMISLRRNGESLPEIIGDELGLNTRRLIRVFSLVLMVMVGAVFVTTPAGLLSVLTEGWGPYGTKMVWIVVIFIYYVLATMLPIDKLIGRIYPLFGVALLIMAVGVFFGILANDGTMPEITEAFSNHHPNKEGIPLFPGLCITIACGAVSGFHATQSPMMARCLKNEKLGRKVFYGSMITEGLVALIWAAAAVKFADTLSVEGNTPYEKLLAVMTEPGGNINPAIVVSKVCDTWLGGVGAVLAVLGVVAAPVTSGDTAFRSARLIVADMLKIDQSKLLKRLYVSAPLFVIAIILLNVDFDILWRYFAWINQTLSVFTLWAITVWLTKARKLYVISLVPAVWMTLICSTYIFIAPEGFHLPHWIAYTLGGAVTFVALAAYVKNILIKTARISK